MISPGDPLDVRKAWRLPHNNGECYYTNYWNDWRLSFYRSTLCYCKVWFFRFNYHGCILPNTFVWGTQLWPSRLLFASRCVTPTLLTYMLWLVSGSRGSVVKSGKHPVFNPNFVWTSRGTMCLPCTCISYFTVTNVLNHTLELNHTVQMSDTWCSVDMKSRFHCYSRLERGVSAYREVLVPPVWSIWRIVVLLFILPSLKQTRGTEVWETAFLCSFNNRTSRFKLQSCCVLGLHTVDWCKCPVVLWWVAAHLHASIYGHFLLFPFAVPPPTDVTVTCNNLRTTVSWKYSGQPQTYFRVSVKDSHDK